MKTKIILITALFVGLFTVGCTTLDQSRPSSNKAIFDADSRIAPSWIGGQVNCRDSSHFVTRTTPEPSKLSIFNLSFRLDLNTNTVTL